jgi:hypothetical protein
LPNKGAESLARVPTLLFEMLRSDLEPLFGDLRQSEKLSEIKPPKQEFFFVDTIENNQTVCFVKSR